MHSRDRTINPFTKLLLKLLRRFEDRIPQGKIEDIPFTVFLLEGNPLLEHLPYPAALSHLLSQLP
jgi:hypothetical protein